MIEERFHQLLDEAQAAFAAGDLEGAFSLFEQAEALTREAGEVDLADRAYCNAAFVRIEMGAAKEQIPGLQHLFMRTQHTRNRYSAAYNLGAAFIDTGDLDKAIQWAQRSSEIAEGIDNPAMKARANNQAATLALKLSRFEEAECGLESALNALETEGITSQAENLATIQGTLGYVMMCTERLSSGLALCESARETLSQLGTESFLYETLQDLCYGYIHDDQLEQANTCGEQALALAEKHGDRQVIKNCLFLLAETAVRRGDTFRARRYLRELTTFYPEIEMNEEIIDVFLATDLTNVVNLRG